MPRLTALLVLAALALAALGAYDVMRGDPDLATAAEPPPAPAAPPPALDLATAHTSVGTVVTSGGKTLYRFDKDTAKPSKSACTGQCATNWPPLLEDGKPKLTGVEPGLVGIAVRPDGSRQVTLGGWPLYRYSGDKAPAEVRGEGMAGGAWHAVGVNGKPAAATKSKQPAAATKPPPAAKQPPAAKEPAGDPAPPATPSGGY